MPEQTEKLQQEILADAERKVERALKRANREADKIRDAARRENETLRERRMAEAERTAEGQARAIVAGIPYEERRIQLLSREKVFDDVFETAFKELRSGKSQIDRAASLRELLAEALGKLPPSDWLIRVNPRDLKELQDALPELETNGETAVEADDRIDGGVLVLSRDGRLRYDNTFATRFEREKSRLRAELAEILEAETTLDKQ